ncbi:MAG: hypothetical protein NXI10_13675 [bacterium]|nr:hypothetical protein [bacterium]
MTKYYLILIVLLPLVVQGQQDSVITSFCSTWIYYGDEIPDSMRSYVNKGDTLYYTIFSSKNDSIRIEEGWYADNRKVGPWIKYHEDGVTPKLIGEYRNNRPSGKYKKIYANGRVKEQGTYYKGKYYGELKRYYESGCLRYCGRYNYNGIEEDTAYYYFDCDSVNCCEKGQLQFIYFAVDGKPTGIVYRYYRSGRMHQKFKYNADGMMEEELFFEDDSQE